MYNVVAMDIADAGHGLLRSGHTDRNCYGGAICDAQLVRSRSLRRPEQMRCFCRQIHRRFVRLLLCSTWSDPRWHKFVKLKSATAKLGSESVGDTEFVV